MVEKIKCGCGHYPKDHYNGEGACSKCACTWYYPNDDHILAKNKERAYKCTVYDLKTGNEIDEKAFLDSCPRKGREYLVYNKKDFMHFADFNELCKIVNLGMVRLETLRKEKE